MNSVGEYDVTTFMACTLVSDLAEMPRPSGPLSPQRKLVALNVGDPGLEHFIGIKAVA